MLQKIVKNGRLQQIVRDYKYATGVFWDWRHFAEDCQRQRSYCKRLLEIPAIVATLPNQQSHC